MSKRAKFLWAASLLVLAGSLLVVYRWPQPTYQGKPLNWWVQQPMSLNELDSYLVTGEAMRHFGAAAVPELLRRAKPTAWQRLKQSLAARGWTVFASKSSVSASKWNRQMALAEKLLALDAQAEPFAEELWPIFMDENSGAFARSVLPSLVTSNTTKQLVARLKSSVPGDRTHALVALICPNAHKVDPALLLGMLGDTNRTQDERILALRALGASGLLPREGIPAMTNLLSDTNSWVQYYAALALAELGTRPEIPAAAVQAALADGSTELSFGRARRVASCVMQAGAITRGPVQPKRLALCFTGHEFAEGAGVILDALSNRQARASFFLTGTFLGNTNFTPLTRRMFREGHYVGMHSDRHLLYCAWDPDRRTLVSRWEFRADLIRNYQKVLQLHELPDNVWLPLPTGVYMIPPYEHYNRDIVNWAKELNVTLINYTPGTRSNADYTEDNAPNFVSSQAIFDSILARERSDPNGLNGFLLLLHLGAGPKRTDKFHTRFDELLTVLAAKGYQFVRVDELLASPPEPAG
jgi:peptidoglycan/xylan/chitin deacetylase (PgdA/CDA1 family)